MNVRICTNLGHVGRWWRHSCTFCWALSKSQLHQGVDVQDLFQGAYPLIEQDYVVCTSEPCKVLGDKVRWKAIFRCWHGYKTLRPIFAATLIAWVVPCGVTSSKNLDCRRLGGALSDQSKHIEQLGDREVLKVPTADVPRPNIELQATRKSVLPLFNLSRSGSFFPTSKAFKMELRWSVRQQ